MNYLNQISKFNQILILLLAIQIAIGTLVFWPDAAASGNSGPLFADLKASDVVEFIISDNNDTHIKIAKQGENWILPEAGNYPVQEENVTTLLEKIEGIETNRLVTQTDASHRRLRVAADNFNRLLELTMANGSTYNFFIGSQAGSNATHVRADGHSEVYLTGQLNPQDARASASSWIETLYFEAPQAEVVLLTLANANGTFEFVKTGESWSLTDLTGDEVFNNGAVTTLLNQAASVRLSAPLGTESQPSYGLDNPQAIITLQTITETFTLQVGAQSQDENNSYAFKASTSPYFVQVTTFTGDAFVNKTRADFLQAPPSETEEAPPVSQ